MEVSSIFDEKFKNIVSSNINVVFLENTEEENAKNSIEKPWTSQNANNMSCSYCRIDFLDVSSQREHYKLDWHRFNLKQSLSGRNPITEDEFLVKNANDDISSISGSDSDKEDTLDNYASSQGKILLRNQEGQVFSLYKSLIFKKKDEIVENTQVQSWDFCVTHKLWAIFMIGGGHFAGAIFNDGKPILHKTFHCYTVRQGQGGSQSSKDNKSGSSHPKSAGSSLRRYNEQALIQHVRDICEQWKIEIDKCSRIFYRASGPYNRTALFGNTNPFLESTDARLRPIPFTTRRATYKEVQRVFSLLSTVQLFENIELAVRSFDVLRSHNREMKKNKVRVPQINRAKSREVIERPQPTKHSSETNSLADSESEEEIDVSQISIADHEISFEHLKEFESTEISKKNRKEKKVKKSKAQKMLEREVQRKNEIIDILVKGNLIKLKELAENIECNLNETQTDIVELKSKFMNEVLDDDGNYLLHIAAKNEHSEVVKYLLENNSDPCLRNKKLQTPYSCTSSKEVREVMKEFAKLYPDKYNYNKAQIPVNTLSPEELAEKKKAQKKIKKEKEKIKKEEQKLKRIENDERERFLKLSDREKSALAAERRILSAKGQVICRCFLCAADMSGKVPFEYLGNRFCSMDCLKAHRLQNTISLR